MKSLSTTNLSPGFLEVIIQLYYSKNINISLDSKTFSKLELAVKGRNGKNMTDLDHLDQFVHTSR